MVGEGAGGGSRRGWAWARVQGARRLLVGMAVNVLMPLLIPLGEQITNVTQVVGRGSLFFTQPRVEVFVKENTAPVLLLTLHAVSNTTTSEVVYSVVAGGMGGLFRADSRTGHLTLTAPLDYETRSQYELVVGGRAGEERAYGRVVVLVTDVNDLPPTFSRPLFETQITEEDDRHLPKAILQYGNLQHKIENSVVHDGDLQYNKGVSNPERSSATQLETPQYNTVLHQYIKVVAEDGDESDMDQLRYTLAGDDHPETNTTFSISHTTGHIHLLRPLDRDAPSGRARWKLWVEATDGAHTAHAQVHVNVKDINDNAPFFPHDVIDATVLENADAGTEVTRVEATDQDDPQESTNALITYSVDKNVIDEQSGRPIFSIDAVTGRIRTALCCLDREQTSSFVIQVVASDGGGLKGTGTVVVSLGDENDVGPHFTRREWLVTVHETVPANTSLALLSVHDPDTTNDFAFRVVEGSGTGWERFSVVASGNYSGALQALHNLDYEDPAQRAGFRFKVQVSDKAEERWEDEEHLDAAWVRVELQDDNDNDPHLATTLVNLTLSETTPLGHFLASFTASDLDQGGDGEIHYVIDPSSDPGRRFAVDDEGRVRLQRVLDRETATAHRVRVLAVDGGEPARTATATLLLTVTDVNDNAPHVAGPSLLQVPENSGPRHIARITLDDADDWTLGHGPPFTAKLADAASLKVKEDFAVDFDARGDEGRGVAVVASLRPLDREEEATRQLPLVLGDARGLSATVTVTVTVADTNDNPMRPAAKTVFVTRITGQAGAVPLGRVYVDDPDDWDTGEKTWAWRQRNQHPLFTLDTYTGHLAMSTHASDGMYFLQFWVSDAAHGQVDVPANVTVQVASLSRDVIPWAVPVTLSSHLPRDLITPDPGTGRSPLQSLVASVESIADAEVVVVSLEGQSLDTSRGPETQVWLAARPRQPLDQLLLLHRHQVSRASGVEVSDVGVGVCLTHPHQEQAQGPRAWVVDANTTAVITPRFHTMTSGCSCHTRQPQILEQQPEQVVIHSAYQPNVAAVTRPSSCQPNPCLNGGRCIPRPRRPSCVCPRGTSGSVCKQLSRHFLGHGWAWVSPIPTCPHVHITLEFRTSCSNCLLLYAGPGPTSVHPSSQFLQEDVLSVELRDGRLWVMLDLGTSPVLLAPSTVHRRRTTSHLTPSHQTSSLDDGHWHRLDIIWGQQKAEVIVDTCERGGECRLAASLPPTVEGLRVAAPLQVGGLAHAPPHHLDHGWPAPLAHTSFTGCIRNLRINGELRDLGEEVLSNNSSPGCPVHDPCQTAGKPCSSHARCVENEGPVCECNPGWSGVRCDQRTRPSSFSGSSYVKMALTTSPQPNTTTLQLRFRTWEESGQLLSVTSHHGRDQLTLQLVGGHVCVELVLHHRSNSHLCLSRTHLNDGKWHGVKANRYGEWLELLVDEGDGPLYNSTPTPSSLQGWTVPLMVDRHEGVHVGGSPEYVGVSLHTVHNDFHDGCLDDLRVSGVSLPLPPLTNTSIWAQATMFTNVHASCLAPAVCTNVTCSEPLTCVDVWRRHECGCGEGSALMRETGICMDVNECLWSPCFNHGTCVNQKPGYICLCSKAFTGEHCEVAAKRYPSLTLSFSALVVMLVLSVIILVIILGVYILYRRRHRQMRSLKAGDDITLATKTSHELESINLEGADNTEIKGEGKDRQHSSWGKDTQLTGVDVLHRDKKPDKSKDTAPDSGCGCPHLPSLDDLRYYAYEGDGSSPGSLSSCCSGVDGVDEVRLLGGFQDVAALLNCLVGQQDTHSPTHQRSQKCNHSHRHTSDTLGTPVAARGKTEKGKDNRYSSPSKTLKTGLCETRDKNGTTLKETKIQSSLINRKCNSLPRSRAPKIFVNNLHDYTREGGTCPGDRGCYSLRRNRASAAAASDTDHPGTSCYTTTHSCKTRRVPPPRGFEENSLTLLSTGREMCLACNTSAALLGDDKWKTQAVPRRSRSSSTVSYIGSETKLPSCLCSLAQTSSEAPSAQPTSEQERTCSYSDQHLGKSSNVPAVPTSCACSGNQISVISTRGYKEDGSDKLFLL